MQVRASASLEVSSSGTQVAASPPDRVGAVVWGAIKRDMGEYKMKTLPIKYPLYPSQSP